MKLIDRLISFIFDIAIMVVAVAILLVKFDVIQAKVLLDLLNDYLFNPQNNTIVILSCVVVLLLALKITVFTSSFNKKTRKNILVDTEHGKIQIAQNTIENIAKNTVKEYPQVKDVQAVMTKAKKGINLYMSLVAYQGINIKDVVTSVQADVKNQIESAVGINVCNVDVKIKNVIKIDNMYKNTKVNEEIKTSKEIKVAVESAEKAIPETTSEEVLETKEDVTEQQN